MNKRIAFGLIIFLSITSCMSSPAAPTKVLNSKVTVTTTSKPAIVPTLTVIPFPQITDSSLSFVNENSLQPGIYPVLSGLLLEDGLYVETVSTGGTPSFVYLGNASSILSPDGHSVIYMDYDQLWEYNFVTGDKRKVPQPDLNDGELVWAGSWSPDGKYITYIIFADGYSSDNPPTDMNLWGYYVADLENNQFIKIANWMMLTNHPPLWSPDGKWIAFLLMPETHSPIDSSNTDLYLFDTTCLLRIETCQSDSVKQLTDTLTTGSIWEMSWSPDSKKIVALYASYTQTYDIYTVDLQGHMINLTNTPTVYKEAVSWSPRGDEIVFRSSKGTVAYGELQLLSLENGLLTTINDAPDNEYVGEPKWSPDGNYIAYTSAPLDSNVDSAKVYSIKQKRNFTLSANDGHSHEVATWLSILPLFQIGTVLKVSPYGNNLNLHDKPSLSSTVISRLPMDQVITIIAGPEQADDYTWWEVKAGDLTGWVAQVPLWYLANNPLVIDGQ